MYMDYDYLSIKILLWIQKCLNLDTNLTSLSFQGRLNSFWWSWSTVQSSSCVGSMVSLGLVNLEQQRWTPTERPMMFSSWSSTTELTPLKVGKKICFQDWCGVLTCFTYLIQEFASMRILDQHKLIFGHIEIAKTKLTFFSNHVSINLAHAVHSTFSWF